jgi:hypothetical protein
MVDFNPNVVEVGEGANEERIHLGDCSGREWTPEREIQVFGSIAFECV